MIRCVNVAKSFDFGASWAVYDLNLQIAAGEFFVLLGESGSGKTTVLKMLNRLIEPSSGSIHVGGVNIAATDPVGLRRGIGYVIQDIGLFPHLTVEENAGIVLSLVGTSGDQVVARAREVLQQVGLDPNRYGRRLPHELSGGQKQRVGVARALAAKPGLMLLDEPFGALDPITRSGLQTQFYKLQRELGLTAVMVTHDVLEALLIADRIAILKDGSIIAQGRPTDLLRNPGHPYAQSLLQTQRRQAEQIHKMMEGDTGRVD